MSSVLACFEDTISKNNEAGVCSGMYLTNIASGKTKTVGTSVKPTNSRMSMTAKVTRCAKLDRQDSDFSLGSCSDKSTKSNISMERLVKRNKIKDSVKGRHSSNSKLFPSPLNLSFSGSCDKGDDDDDSVDSLTFEDDDWDFEEEVWDCDVNNGNRSSTTTPRSKKHMSESEDADCFAVMYSHKDMNSDPSIRSFSDHMDCSDWCRIPNSSKITFADDEDGGKETKHHRIPSSRGSKSSGRNEKGRDQKDSKDQHSLSSLSRVTDDEGEVKKNHRHYSYSDTRSSRPRRSRSTQEPNEKNDGVEYSRGRRRKDSEERLSVSIHCKNISDEDELKPPQFSRSQSERQYREKTSRSASPSRRGFRASEGRRQMRRTSSSDETMRASRRFGRRKACRNDDDSASNTSVSAPCQKLYSADSEESITKNELKSFLVKQNSRTSLGSQESRKFLTKEDSKTSLTTQSTRTSHKSNRDDDSETMECISKMGNLSVRSEITEEIRPPMPRRANSEDSLDRRCSRRPARRVKTLSQTAA